MEQCKIAEAVELLTLWAHVQIASAQGPAGQESAAVLVSGQYALPFRIGLVAFGIVLPLVINVLIGVKGGNDNAAPAAVSGEASTGNPNRAGLTLAYLVALTGTIVGAFALRVVIIFAAQVSYISAF